MDEMIIAMAKQGVKRSDIAKKLQITKRDVLNVLCVMPSFHVLTDEDAEISRGWEDEMKQFNSQKKDYQIEISNRIYQLRDQGKTMREICDYLNNCGYKNSRGLDFKTTAIFRILERRNRVDRKAEGDIASGI